MLGRMRWAAGAFAVGVSVLWGATIVMANDAVITADGHCLRLRESPSLTAPVVTCLGDGSVVDALDTVIEADGYAWRQVDTGRRTGWVAAVNLQRSGPPSASAAALVAPPEGGVTVGVAGTDSIPELIAAQDFPVASVAVFDVAMQQFRTYFPGAPAVANTLPEDGLRAGSVVLVRRAGVFVRDPRATQATISPERGVASALAMPPRGGLTTGMAGTPDLDELIAAQPFTVDAVWAWDVVEQRWLTYWPGGSAALNTLTDGMLSADTPVFLRRGDAPTDPAVTTLAAKESVPARMENITYYFCRRGSNPLGWGDGGGWCGGMRNGEIVHDGAAACAPDRLGERFRIEGDPTERVYTCTDTGGAVGSAHRDIWFENSDDGYLWWRQVGGLAQVTPLE